MVSNAVVAPRGSAFISERGNLTPAWHHYLAQIEMLTKGITVTDTGAALAEVAQRLDALEVLVTEAEKLFSKRNWSFYFTEEADNTFNGHNVVISHDLDTKFVIARARDSYNGGNGESQTAEILDAMSVNIGIIGGTYEGNGRCKGWALGFHDF